MKRIHSLVLLASTVFSCVSTVESQSAPSPETPAPVASATTASPTMEQTIAFINESLSKQGEFEVHSQNFVKTFGRQSVRLDQGCLLERSTPYKDQFLDSPILNQTGTRRELLHLDLTDARRVSLQAMENGNPVYYEIFLEKAVYDFRPLDVQPQAHIPDLNGDYTVNGIVKAVTSTFLTLITDEAAEVNVPFDMGAEVMRRPPYSSEEMKTDLSDIAAGDSVHIYRTSNEIIVKKKKVDKFDQHIILIKNTGAPQKFSFASFVDKDSAQRVAKALIHAIVLCHKDQPAPLFN